MCTIAIVHERKPTMVFLLQYVCVFFLHWSPSPDQFIIPDCWSGWFFHCFSKVCICKKRNFFLTCSVLDEFQRCLQCSIWNAWRINLDVVKSTGTAQQTKITTTNKTHCNEGAKYSKKKTQTYTHSHINKLVRLWKYDGFSVWFLCATHQPTNQLTDA